MKHIVRLFLCAALLLTVLFIQTAQAEPEPVRCVPGETIEVSFVLPDSAGGAAGMMGTLRYDYSVFTLLPSPGVIGQNGVYISSQPVSLSFAVSQYAPVGEYAITVTVLEAYYADGRPSEITDIEPVPVSVVPASYSVRYEPGAEDSGIQDIPAPQEKAFRETLTLSSVRPARAGYDFMGWAASAGGKAVYQPGDTYQDDQDVTLWAVWKAVPNGRLDVNGWLDDNQTAGGTDGYGTFDMYINGKLVKDDVCDFWEEVPADCAYEIKNITPSGGHTFLEAAEGKLQGTVPAGQTVNIRLKFASIYTIDFNKNTTDSVSNMPDALKKQHGQGLSISSKVPTRSGHIFQGWALSAGGNVQYRAGSACTENKNLTLYAVWQPMGTLDVNGWLDDNKTAGDTKGYGTFDVYIDGKLVQNDVADYYQYVSPGSSYEIKDIKPSAGHKYAQVADGKLQGTVESGKGVSVRLKFLSRYTIQFNKNTTDSVTGMPSEQEKYHGESLKLSSQKPVRLGYTFQGWSLSAGGTAKYQPGAACTENKNTTLYAVWQAPSSMFESLNVATYYFSGNMRYLIQIYLKGVKQRTTFKNVKVSWTDTMVYSATENNLKSNNTISFQETEKNGDKKLNIVLPKERISNADQTIQFQYGDEVITVSVRLTYNSGTWHVDFLGYKVSKA